MNECIFCKIINNELPSYTIYEDDELKVFLDINPSTNGDMLLIPKKHVVTINDIDCELMNKMLKVEKNMYKLMKEKLNAKGLTIAQNNDYGQEVKHFHIHLTPRYENDLLEYKYDKENINNIEYIYNKLVK